MPSKERSLLAFNDAIAAMIAESNLQALAQPHNQTSLQILHPVFSAVNIANSHLHRSDDGSDRSQFAASWAKDARSLSVSNAHCKS